MTKRTLSIGKYRALQRASTADGLFTILAIDHQDVLRQALNPADPRAVTPADLTAFKLDVVTALAPLSSGTLLDPVYGAPQAIAGDQIPHGLLLEVEKADYDLKPLPLVAEVRPGWSISKIKRLGGDGAKLFFYYRPDAPEHAAVQEALIRGLVAECVRCELPLYAEPILYRLNDQPVASEQITSIVIESARRIAALGADVLKLEFPRAADDREGWDAACRAVTDAVDVPWALLSAGVSFDVFVTQVETACRQGASGFIAGRAVWGEAASFDSREDRINWLHSVGRDRMERLGTIAEEYGRSWRDCVDVEPVSETWFQTYPSLEG